MKRFSMRFAILLFCILNFVEINNLNAQTTKTVGGAGADYSTLKLAFDSINAGSITGAITLQITGSTTETATAKLVGGAYTSVNIYPTSNGLSISGNIAGSLLHLYSADNVTIDGRVNATGSTRDLIISNSSTSSANETSAIELSYDAKSNLIKYCIIKSSETNANSGVIFFSVKGGAMSATGNDDNTIVNNLITTALPNSRPINGVYSSGSLNATNSGNTISNNHIYNSLNLSAASNGINLALYNTTWTIFSNSFYETSSFNPTASVEYNCINISDITSTDITISDNFIGGNLSGCIGTWVKTNAQTNTFNAIRLKTSTSVSSIQGNTIKGFSWGNQNGADWTAINIIGGTVDIGTISGNIIGASTGTGSIEVTNGQNASVYGINIQTGGFVNCQNNSIGSINAINGSSYSTSFYGINKTANAGSTTISNNLIGSNSTALSINASGTSTQIQYVYGIHNLGTGVITISGNTIANMKNASLEINSSVINGISSVGDASVASKNTFSNNVIHNLTIANANINNNYNSSACGILLTDLWAKKRKTVSGNTIYNISNTNTSFAGCVMGIYFQGSADGNTVTKNFIYNLTVTGASSTAAKIYGINIASGNTTYSNNIISLGGNSKTTIFGMYDLGNYVQDCNMYYNTIYIGGSLASGSTNKSYCIYSDYDGYGNDIRNNILSNTRSTVSGSSLHYGIYFNYYTALGATFKLSNNDYYAPGTGGKLGHWYGADKTATPIITGETNSLAINPIFTNAGGTTATDYNISAASLVAVTGTGIIVDYSGTNRSGTAPIMGAFESLTPLISITPTSLIGFQYEPGAGPSAEQTFTVSGANLIANITITPTTDFEISTTSGSGFQLTPITLTQTGGVVSTTTIYVRLKAGLASATYPPENIACTSSGATTKNVACSGIVGIIPTITVSTNSISGFNYVQGSGPSAEQSFTVSGTHLTHPINIDPSANYEISTTSGVFGLFTSISLSPSGGTVANTTIYVRLMSGLSKASYNENITLTSTNAFTKYVLCNGDVSYAAQVWKNSALEESYTTLKGAFDAINSGTHTGALEIKIANSLTESVAAVLNASGTGAASYTSINIYPTTNSLSITNSGNLTELIDLNGANNVTIDGRVNATGAIKGLTINNTYTYATSTIRFINDASNNVVKYCNLKGSAYLYGILYFSTTSGSTGNDNNLIIDNNITCSSNSNRPYNAIYSLGTAAKENSENTISKNNIYDFMNTSYHSYGVYFGANTTTCTIIENSFYETTSLTTNAYNFAPIYINNTSGTGFVISGNYIGGSAALAAGTWSKSSGWAPFYAIYLNVGTAVSSSIQNNVIKNFSWTNTNTTSWTGIHIQAGNVNIGTTTGNTIGASTGTGSIVASFGNTGNFYGINIVSAGTIDCQNNIIGSITAANAASTGSTSFIGILKSAVAGTTNISNNLIGSTSTANSVAVTCLNTNAQNEVAYGIYSQGTAIITINSNTIANISSSNTSAAGLINGITSTAGTNTITNNTVRDLTIANSAGTGAAASIAGISLNSTSAAKTVTKNTIYNLTNTHATFTGDVIGLFFQGNTGANIVSGNFIHNLLVTGASSTAASIYGININSGASTYSNNIISLGGNSKTMLYGIFDAGVASQTCNAYFNTIFIYGTAPSGSNKSYALYSNENSNNRDYRNNILQNARSTTSGSNLHYAIYLNYSNISNLTSDYNDLYFSGTGGVIGYYNITNYATKSAFATATSTNAHSQSKDALFATPEGDLASDYYPTQTNMASLPIASVTYDYDDFPRSTEVCTIGAFELSYDSNVLPVELLSFEADCMDKSIEITWQTASEINSDYFKLERSIDLVEFETVEEISAAGNSNSLIEYSVYDNLKYNVPIYYRLKEFDIDGKYVQYKPIVLNCNSEKNIKFTVNPNPFSDKFTISILSTKGDIAKIKLYDLDGRLKYSNSINLQSFESKVNVIPGNITKGIYIVEVEIDATIKYFKVVKY